MSFEVREWKPKSKRNEKKNASEIIAAIKYGIYHEPFHFNQLTIKFRPFYSIKLIVTRLYKYFLNYF